MRFDYDTTTIRRCHNAFDYDGSDRNYDLRSIRLRYDYDMTTTKNWTVNFLLTSNRVEWKQARAIRRSRIVVVSQSYRRRIAIVITALHVSDCNRAANDNAVVTITSHYAKRCKTQRAIWSTDVPGYWTRAGIYTQIHPRQCRPVVELRYRSQSFEAVLQTTLLIVLGDPIPRLYRVSKLRQVSERISQKTRSLNHKARLHCLSIFSFIQSRCSYCGSIFLHSRRRYCDDRRPSVR